MNFLDRHDAPGREVNGPELANRTIRGIRGRKDGVANPKRVLPTRMIRTLKPTLVVTRTKSVPRTVAYNAIHLPHDERQGSFGSTALNRSNTPFQL